MKRLTEKVNNELCEYWTHHSVYDCLFKLGRLEDIEEELKLNDLQEFLQCLEPNTLFRIMPYEKAKIIDDFRRKFVKELSNEKED